MANIAKTFRQTAAGVKLGKALFSPTAVSISPVQITSLLQQMGIKVPNGARVGADVAQIIMSGGAFTTAVDSGASIASLAVPGIGTLRAASDLLSIAGLMDPKSPGAVISRVGLDTCLVLATGGMNVLADISLIFDVFGGFFGGLISQIGKTPEQIFSEKLTPKLYSQSFQEAQAYYLSRENSQQSAASQFFGAYQNGKISVFEMLGKVAESSPDLFLNYFPQMKSFFPPITITKDFTSSETNKFQYGYGVTIDWTTGKEVYLTKDITTSATYTLNLQSIQNDHKTVQRELVQQFLIDPYEPYKKISQMTIDDLRNYGYPKAASKIGVFDHIHPVPRMKLSDLAVLSMFPPYFQYFHDDFDIKPYLCALLLTPSDLGYPDLITSQMWFGDYGKKIVPHEPAFSINGVDYWNPSDSVFNHKAYSMNHQVDVATNADTKGNIYNLLKCKRAERIVTEWGILPFYPGAQEGLTSDSNPKGYRNIRNYWSAISLSSLMKNDGYFADFNVKGTVDSFLQTQDEIDSKFRKLQFLVVGRKLNLNARKNIANFLGADVSKLTFSTNSKGLISVR